MATKGKPVCLVTCCSWCLSDSVDLCLCSYLNTVQTTCPHILRYITAAAIISKRRKSVMKDLVKIIQQVRVSLADGLYWSIYGVEFLSF
jgi:hypothetical protein